MERPPTPFPHITVELLPPAEEDWRTAMSRMEDNPSLEEVVLQVTYKEVYKVVRDPLHGIVRVHTILE